MELTPQRLSRLAQLWTLGLVLLCGVASLTWPFGWDQAVFAQVGDVINHGGLPYRDAWDIKGPLTYYVLAVSQALFGTNQWGIRLVDFALLLTGGWALARTAGALTSADAGRWAALVFMLLYLAGGYWDAAQPDGWVALLLALAGALLVVPVRRDRVLPVGIAGALVGLCTLMKWLYAAFLLVPLVAVLTTPPPHARTRATRVASVLAGFLVPVAACVAWFLAHGALNDLVEVHLRYPYVINSRDFGVTSLNLPARARGIAQFVMKPHVLAALPAIAVGMLVLWRTVRRTGVLVGLWSAIALGCVMLQSRFADYHWLPAYPPLALLCAVGLHAALRGSHDGRAVGHRGPPRETAPLLAMLTVAVLAFYATIYPAVSVARWAAFAAGVWDEEQYYGQFRYAESGMKAAQYLRERTTARNQVALWGNNPAILYLSRRVSPTRFGFHQPLIRGEGTGVRAEYRAEFLHTLQRARPTYFVVLSEDLSETPVPNDLRGFPELLTFVMQNYQLERTFDSVTLYRRREDVGADQPAAGPVGASPAADDW
jgi:Dolichyl-phosphate-mannose-protein mannosyltransferase